MDYKSILSHCSLPLKTELSEGTEYRENLSLTLFLTALNNIKLKVCTNYTYSPGSKREKKNYFKNNCYVNDSTAYTVSCARTSEFFGFEYQGTNWQCQKLWK